MPRKRLIWRLFPLFVLVAAGSLLLAALYATRTMGGIYESHRQKDLEVRARLIAPIVSEAIQSQTSAELDGLCARLGEAASARVTFISPSGVVLADSGRDRETMDNHGDRPEVIAALQGGVGRSNRYSYTLRANLSYIALPVFAEGEIAGVVRIAVPDPTIGAAVRTIYLEVAGGIVLVGLVVAALSLVASRSITRPVESLRRGAERFANGDLRSRLPLPDSSELCLLANTMNSMASQLEDRIHTVENQRNELQAVLSSMVEGVIAFDSHERVISLNQAAASMFNISREQSIGRVIHEVIRNVELQRFVASILANGEPETGNIVLQHRSQEHLQLQGGALHNAEGQRIGGLVVLHDVTQVHRLETARRDFVSNVSHELRTPITAIKGYVETLLDGAIEDAGAARKFLGVIGRQADRLTALIEDLLRLSRLEQDAEQERLPLEEGRVLDVLERAISVCEPAATAKRIDVTVRCDNALTARMNAQLLQLAVENLLDNAIKYSDDNTTVTVAAVLQESTVVISVSDRGCGIEQEHLPRIFERFYRVDKARSRKMGGTGLGLAIVKHIVRAHGGKTTVESTPGQGSAFHIHLPINKANQPPPPPSGSER